jgi:hypothetical protein
MEKLNKQEVFMNTKVSNNILIALIIAFSIIASSYGFFSNKVIFEDKTFQALSGETVNLHGKGLYFNDSVSVASQAKAQDIVTLIIGIPLLLLSLILSNKNSIREKLLLLGTVGYFLYTYVSYTFLAAYNKFYLIYVLIMTLSFFSFIRCYTSNELKEVKNHFGSNFPKKYIGIFNIFTGIGIGILWIGTIISSFGKSPYILEHYSTLVIQGLDLGFIVPIAILSGILLIKNSSLGYLLTSVVIIKGATLLLAIGMMIIFMVFSGVEVPIIQMSMFPFFALVFTINLIIVLKSISQGTGKTSHNKR